MQVHKTGENPRHRTLSNRLWEPSRPLDAEKSIETTTLDHIHRPVYMIGEA